MIDWRSNTKWIIIVIAIIVAFIIIVLSPNIYGIISIILDFLFAIILIVIADHFEKKRQEYLQDRAEKIKHSKEMADEVYSPLYLQVKNEIIPWLKENPFSSRVFFNTWKEIRKGPKAIFIDEDFKKQLDDFLDRVETHLDKLYVFKTKTLPDNFDVVARDVYKVNKEKFKLRVEYQDVDSNPTGTDIYYPTEPVGTEKIIKCLRSGTNPKDYILEKRPGRKITGFWIESGDWKDDDDAKFNSFWQSFKNRIYQNEEFISIPQEAEDILEEAGKIRDKLDELIKKSRTTRIIS